MKKLYISLVTIFFVYSTLHAQINDSSIRQIKLEGAINFRDIGAYSTKEGKTVKTGLIYRSADLSKLSKNDVQKLINLNVNYDFDFRGPYEVKSAPDKIPDNIIRISLPAGSLTIGDSNYLNNMKNRIKDDSFILSFYNDLSPFKERYKPLFDSLLSFQGNKTLVFHCTAGKDRTGIAAALILYALGVNEETILNDYEATNYYRTNENLVAIQQMKKFYGIDEKIATNLMSAKKEYLESTFNTIKSKYSTIEKFLSKEMELDKKKIRLLKKYYTK